MKQEDKELLLRDLCARLPYGVICTDSRHGDSRITEIDIVEETVYCDDFDECVEVDRIKPYLRPMSEIANLINAKEFTQLSGIDLIDWYNANYIDYRTDKEGKTMIPKGLALKAPEGMYH